jgi:hypothetical protein
MARVHFVKAARKPQPSIGVEVGQPYYWWKFRFGGKHVSATYPKRSQLTQSAFYSSLYDLEDRIANLEANDSLPSEVESIVEELRDMASECEDKRSNMPDQLQDSESGSLLESRAETLNQAADDMEAIDFDDVPEEMIQCENCNGDGRLEDPTWEDDETDPPMIDCEECHGDGEIHNEEFSDTYWDDKLTEVQDVSIDAP